MAKISMTGPGTVDGVAKMLRQEIEGSAFSCELVEALSRQIGGGRLRLMVFEKYFMRSSNRASLTVAVSGDDGRVMVDAISAGGGQGVFFRFSWGAESDFVGTVESLLREKGFR